MPADSAKMSFQCRFDKNLTNFPLEIKAASAFANASTAANVSLNDIPTETIELNVENFNAVLRFAYDSRTLTAENKELLLKNYKTYEPEFGGWCAYAMGNTGEKVEIDPETFKIINGKLYLFYNAYFNNTLKLWNKNEANLLKQANTNWTKYY